MSLDSTLTQTAPELKRLGLSGIHRYITVVHPRPSAPRRLTQRVVAGRKPSPGELALEDPICSREHFEVSLVRGALDAVRLRDLDSKNGTFLDGRRIQSEYLKGGHVIRAGASLLVYCEFTRPPGTVPEMTAGEAVATSRLRARIPQVAGCGLPVLIGEIGRAHV